VLVYIHIYVYLEREREREKREIHTHELPTPLLLEKRINGIASKPPKRYPLALLRELSLGQSTTSDAARTDKETIQNASRLRGDFFGRFRRERDRFARKGEI